MVYNECAQAIHCTPYFCYRLYFFAHFLLQLFYTVCNRYPIDKLLQICSIIIGLSKITRELLEQGCTLQCVPGFYQETDSWRLDVRYSVS